MDMFDTASLWHGGWPPRRSRIFTQIQQGRRIDVVNQRLGLVRSGDPDALTDRADGIWESRADLIQKEFGRLVSVHKGFYGVPITSGIGENRQRREVL
jgi:hypothetical protein